MATMHCTLENSVAKLTPPAEFQTLAPCRPLRPFDILVLVAQNAAEADFPARPRLPGSGASKLPSPDLLPAELHCSDREQTAIEALLSMKAGCNGAAGKSRSDESSSDGEGSCCSPTEADCTSASTPSTTYMATSMSASTSISTSISSNSSSEGEDMHEQKRQQRWLRLNQNLEYRKKLKEKGVHPILRGKRQYACSVCYEVFEKEMFVWRHGVKHLQGKPFLCTECGGSFNRSDSLQRHVRNFHRKA